MLEVSEKSIGGNGVFELDRRLPAAAQIYERLRRMIIDLKLEPGETIAKGDLANRFGVSQTPVREALLRLEEEGLVIIKRQSGTFVAPIDVRHASEAHFLRLSIEIEVVKRLCEAITDVGLAELEAVLARQDFELATGDTESFFGDDASFHITMYRLVGVGGLWRSVRSTRAHINRLRMLHLPEPGKMESIVADHKAILAAVRARDVTAADAAIRKHLSGTVASIKALKARYPRYF